MSLKQAYPTYTSPKYVLANEAPFMTKELHKPIMKRFRLRNKFLKTKSITYRKSYNVQWNYCKKLLRSTEKLYFNNLDNDNRSFWKTIGPIFLKKTQKAKILSWLKKVKMSQTMLNCVVFLTNNSTVDSNAVNNPLSIATKLFDQHPSVINTKKKKFDSILNFKTTSRTEGEKSN